MSSCTYLVVVNCAVLEYSLLLRFCINSSAHFCLPEFQFHSIIQVNQRYYKCVLQGILSAWDVVTIDKC